MFKIIRNIGKITRSLQIKSNKQFQTVGLGNNSFIYLIRVCEKPGMFLGEVADKLSIDRTTAFRTIKRLVDTNYLRLEVDSTDGRLRRVFPTDKAKKIYPELHSFEKDSSEKLLSNLTLEEQQTLFQLLEKCSNNI